MSQQVHAHNRTNDHSKDRTMQIQLPLGMRPKNRTGFTLVELAVVIGIIALLAAIIIPSVYGAIGKAREARIGIEIAAIGKALDRYKLEVGEYPPDFTIDAANIPVDEKRRLKRNLITSHLQSVYRRRNAVIIPAGNTGSLTAVQVQGTDQLSNELIDALNPRSAFSFWLTGFSSDPQFPLTNQNGDPHPDRKPLLDLDKSRLNASTGIYGPPGSTSVSQAYIYFRADPGTLESASYLNSVNWALLTNQTFLNSDASQLVPFPAVSSTVAAPDPNTGTSVPAYVAAKKFQLFQCGRDGEYYSSVDLTNGTNRYLGNLLDAVSAAVNQSPVDIVALNQLLQGFPNGENEFAGSQDNLCSFTEGNRLENLKP